MLHFKISVDYCHFDIIFLSHFTYFLASLHFLLSFLFLFLSRPFPSLNFTIISIFETFLPFIFFSSLPLLFPFIFHFLLPFLFPLLYPFSFHYYFFFYYFFFIYYFFYFIFFPIFFFPNFFLPNNFIPFFFLGRPRRGRTWTEH